MPPALDRLVEASRRFARGGVVVALLLAPAGPSVGQILETDAGREEEVTVDAESISYDNRSATVAAEGNVEIRYGDAVLQAETVQLDQSTKQAMAAGGVRLTSPEVEIDADSVLLDLDDETGILENADIYSSEQRYSLSGKRIEKGIGQQYRIENGRFTTCNCAEGAPSWSIAGDVLDVEVDGYATLKGGTFNVMDVPILYLPRAAFPVHRDRQSGLLFPRVGFSNRRGFQIVQPVYWAINKSHDATFGLDVETNRRIGILGEYRYAFRRDIGGTIDATYFNEALRGSANESSTGLQNEPNVPENRWSLQTEHSQAVGSADGYVDLQLVGDDLFLREINTFTIDHARDVKLRTLPFTTSRAGFVQSWSRVALQGEGIFYQDLIGEDDFTLQRAPELRVQGQKQLGFRTLGELTGSVTNFQREDGITGIRGDLRPQAALQLPLGRSFSGTLRAAFRETAYQLTEDEMEGGFLGDDPTAPEIDLPSTSSRETFEVRADLGTAVSRLFRLDRYGFDKLKHTIEPRLEYLYVPNVAQDELPVFDGIDRISHRSLLTYGFVSRLLGRTTSGSKPNEGGEVHELGRVTLAQSYDFERRIPDDTGSSNDRFSDIDFDLRVAPSRYTWVRVFSTFDTSAVAFTSATVAMRLLEPPPADEEGSHRLRVRRSFRIAYRFLVDNERNLQAETAPSGSSVVAPDDVFLPNVADSTPDSRAFRDIQQLESSIVLPVTSRMGFMYAMRYDLREGRFFENHFGVRLVSACDCWSLDIGFTDKSNPNEVELLAQLHLVGLGAFGTGSRFGDVD